MNACCSDMRVWLPLAIGALVFGWRLRPPPAPGPTAVPRAIALPTVHAAPTPKGDVEYVLDAERTTVRFLAETRDGQLLFACPTVRGRLRLCAHEQSSELELHLDLGSLAPLGPMQTSVDLAHMLGVHRGSEIVYRATLLRSSTSTLPGVTERLWLGTLRIGSRLTRQPMQLWQSSVQAQPMRLQGHGTVELTDYGLPRRTWLGLVQENHVVTLGLDLAWRRAHPR